MKPICDYHTHPQGHEIQPYTTALLEPWIRRCREKGIQSIAFTDHDRYLAGVDFGVLDSLRAQFPDIEILAGIELDNDPFHSAAGLRWVEKHWDRLDFVLGSVHFFAGEAQMLDRAGKIEQFEARGTQRAFEEYILELEKLISRGHIDCLAHLDLVKIHGLRPPDYDPVEFFLPILDLAKTGGLAIEASTAGWRKPVGEQYPHESILGAAFKRQIPITTASDAHSYAQLAEDYDRLGEVLLSCGITSTAKFRRHRGHSAPL